MSVQHVEPATGPARSLISDQEFESVRDTVQTNNHGMNSEVADRIVEEALKYVHACVQSSGGLRPSRIVDEGWHALILHTRTYEALCTRLGAFVHHRPEPPAPLQRDASDLERTQHAINAAGYTPDPMLWLAPTDTTIPVAASCQHSPGGPEGTCTGDPDGDGPGGPN
jgi:hypothetical protein